MPDVPAARRDVMSRLIATFIFRWRYPLSALCVLGALVSIPSANITKIDNDITAWFSKSDPVYQDYERFRAEFGGTRNLIVALQAPSPEALFSEATLAYIERITGDIERIDTVQRVESLATATVVDAVPDGLDVRRLIELSRSGGPEAVRRRAVEDELIRGDLVSEDATVTALIVSFDEDRIDAVRGGVIQQIHDTVDPGLPPGIQAFYNGSLEISETYNRITLDNQQKFTPPILLFTVAAIYFTFRSFRKTVLTLIAVGGQRPVDARSLLAARLQLQRPLQHDPAAHRRPGDCRRRAHHAALGRGAAPRRRRAGVHQHRRAPDGAAARRQRHDGARACCRWRRATSSRCVRSASARRSASWSTSSSRWC